MESASSIPHDWRTVIPEVDVCGAGQGHLLEALHVCGAVFLAPGWGQAYPSGRFTSSVSRDRGVTNSLRPIADDLALAWERWRSLLVEATYERERWRSRPCVHGRHLRISANEDLRRTQLGKDKQHLPDCRSTFGLSDCSARSPFLDWADLKWIRDGFFSIKARLTNLMEHELSAKCTDERGASQSFGVKLSRRRELWGSTALRHCFYGSRGCCSPHTDYGIATLQYSDAPGLQAFIDSRWFPITPPPGFSLLFAGDMLERLTNGKIKALLHRVEIDVQEPASWVLKPDSEKGLAIYRQSHILFLQPDEDTIIQPLIAFQDSKSGSNFEPIRYGDWHKQKVQLAFNREKQ